MNGCRMVKRGNSSTQLTSMLLLGVCAGMGGFASGARAATFFDVPTLDSSTTTPVVDESWDGFADGEVTLTFQADPDDGQTEGFDDDSPKVLSNTDLKALLGLEADTSYGRLRNFAVSGTLSSTLTVEDTTGGLAQIYLILSDVDQSDVVFVTSGGVGLPGSRFIDVFDFEADTVHKAEYNYNSLTGEFSSIGTANTGDYLAVFNVTGLSSVDLMVSSNGVQFQAAVVRVPEAASGMMLLGALVLGGVAMRRKVVQRLRVPN